MKPIPSVALTVVLSSSMVSPAAAAPPGQVAVSVERLFGLSRVSSTAEIGGESFDSTATSISLLGTPFIGPAYSSPRLAIDYLHDSGLSIGAGLSYQTLSIDDETDGEPSASGPDVSVFVLAPRLGYVARATPALALWPRAGITHRSVGTEGGGTDATLTALSVELSLIYLVAADHVGLSVMPHVDVGVAGKVGSGSDAIDQTATEFGVQFGLSLFF